MSPIAFDHVVMAVPDLDEAAARLLASHGLASVPGGRHAGLGTANRIVPLGIQYLELVAVVDENEARANTFGRWVAGEIEGGRGLVALCLRCDEFEGVAGRLGLDVQAWSRRRPDGFEVRFRLAGLEAAMGPERLPFFIQWDVPEAERPWMAPAAHRAAPEGISWVEAGCDPRRLAGWLGDTDLDLRSAGDEPGVRAVGIRTGGAEIVLRG